MAKCVAVKRDGMACSLPATAGSEYCWARAPENAETRRKTAFKAGSKSSRSKASAELLRMYEKLDKLGGDVVAGRVNRANASVGAQCYGIAIRAYEALVKLKELDELKLPEYQDLKRQVEELRGSIEIRSSTAR